ncbi:MAG TPA: hypothetical protein PJ995_21590 [Cyclobacteriaceae bacterium]|nr:hypothetical protein [Cyclobacteriaceae bacterium]
MLPMKSGDIIIGKYLDDLQQIKSGNTYIIVSKEGIAYKRVYKIGKESLLMEHMPSARVDIIKFDFDYRQLNSSENINSGKEDKEFLIVFKRQ